jgi:hypothetical protein
MMNEKKRVSFLSWALMSDVLEFLCGIRWEKGTGVLRMLDIVK